jgi:serine/threonine-protein kinase RsbW
MMTELPTNHSLKPPEMPRALVPPLLSLVTGVLDAVRVALETPVASSGELRHTARRLYASLVAVPREVAERPPLAVELAPTVVKRWAYDPRSVGQARRELRSALTVWELDCLAEPAELVLSELLTNSVCHATRRAMCPGGSDIETRYIRMAAGVRIEVHDADDTWPVLRTAESIPAECGRGLGLVNALTGTHWGVSRRDGIGKCVWAEVSDTDSEVLPQ